MPATERIISFIKGLWDEEPGHGDAGHNADSLNRGLRPLDISKDL